MGSSALLAPKWLSIYSVVFMRSFVILSVCSVTTFYEIFVGVVFYCLFGFLSYLNTKVALHEDDTEV